jgi:ketosteroid isomerase-like protein
MSDHEQIRSLIENLNEAWQAGRFDELDAFYHPDVVLLPPDSGEPIVGRAAVVTSYRDFFEAANLHEFQTTSLETYAFDSTAVCHMRFEIEYTIDSGRFRETGLEVYVLTIPTSQETQPVIIWRSQAVLEAAEVIPNSASE